MDRAISRGLVSMDRVISRGLVSMDRAISRGWSAWTGPLARGCCARIGPADFRVFFVHGPAISNFLQSPMPDWQGGQAHDN